MAEKIEVEIDNIDVQLKTIEGKIKGNGEIVLSFNCDKCLELCKPIFKYTEADFIYLKMKEHLKPREYNCEHCGTEYLIYHEISTINSVKRKKIK